MIRWRKGGVLLETLLALALGAAILASFSGVLASSLQWARSLIGRTEALEVVRTVWVVLDEELRPGEPGRDWVTVSERAIALRAFRGVARICTADAADTWTVAYRGRRLPDAGRDSILVLGADGGWRAFDLAWAEPGGNCAAESGERIMRWRWLQEDAPSPILARVFERGEYHLTDGALRYRRGAGGRQPLTPERLGAESRFLQEEGGIRVRLHLSGGAGEGVLEPFEWPVRAVGADGSPNDSPEAQP